jgi:ubiquinone/menaquinone biosynthesis C-methylase UbiE
MRKQLVLAGAALALFVLVSGTSRFVSAQQPGVHPISGRVYAGVMGYQGADWLERPEREEEEAPDDAIAALNLKRGDVVADVGSGSGFMSEKMSKKVGPTGKVYAEDIQPQMLELLQKRIDKQKLTNIIPVLGTFDDPKLPSAALDLELMVDVYHEFQQPQIMLRHLRDALKPDGRMVLLEYRKEDPSIPIQPAHKMSVEVAKLEVEAEGFKLSKVDEVLPRQHILIFTKR